MIGLEDCIAMCGLEPEEVTAYPSWRSLVQTPCLEGLQFTCDQRR